MSGGAGQPKDWASFQYEVYLNGMTGAVPRLPTDLTRLEELADPGTPPQLADLPSHGR